MNNYTQFDPTNPPPPLMTGEPGSFAHRTMTTRFPVIIQNVLTDHAGQYPVGIVRAIQSLYDELVQNQVIHPLETSATDGPAWATAWRPYQGRTWLDIPWYFAEAFIYRRLVEAAGYFGGGEEAGGDAKKSREAEGQGGRDNSLNSGGQRSVVGGQAFKSGKKGKDWVGVDPFLPRKQVELQSAVTWQVLAAALKHALDGSVDSLRALLHHCLWGNRLDLSYTQVAEAASGQIALANEQANLLVDDTGVVLSHLPVSGGRIDFICDNAGTELLMDLALVDFLLRFDWAATITLHVKAHPTFVSDTIAADIELTLAAMKAQHGTPEFAALATRLEGFQAQKRLRVRPDIFWNSSYFFWEIPADLQAELGLAHLVVIKGDANYRRLLGDSRWPTTVPVTAAIPYFLAPFVALRTLKSDPIVGLQPGQAEALDRQDPEWRVNGRRGMIQFVER